MNKIKTMITTSDFPVTLELKTSCIYCQNNKFDLSIVGLFTCLKCGKEMESDEIL